MSTRGQEARQRDESRRIIDCVLCIITLFMFLCLLFCTCIGVCSNNNDNNNNNKTSSVPWNTAIYYSRLTAGKSVSTAENSPSPLASP